MPWTDTEILAFSDFETFKGQVVTTTKLLAGTSVSEVHGNVSYVMEFLA